MILSLKRACLFVAIGFAATAVPVGAQSKHGNNGALKSGQFDQAEEAWRECALRYASRLPSVASKAGAVFELLNTICLGERERVTALITSFVMDSGAKPTGVHVQSAMSDRAYTLADWASRKVKAEIRPVVAAPIPLMKGSFARGLKAYRARDYETALAYWLPEARIGNADAQNNIGLFFENGFSVHTPIDDAEAETWFRLAAAQENVLAIRNLARLRARYGFDENAKALLQTAETIQKVQTEQHLASRAMAQQRTQQQTQESLGALAYLLGCAIGGGCGSGYTSGSAAGAYRDTFRNRAPASAATIAPSKVISPPPVCKLSPYAVDLYGNPKVECR